MNLIEEGEYDPRGIKTRPTVINIQHCHTLDLTHLDTQKTLRFLNPKNQEEIEVKYGTLDNEQLLFDLIKVFKFHNNWKKIIFPEEHH